MSALDNLKAAKSRADLAKLLNFRQSALSFILFKLPPAAKYHTFEIAKRNGGSRTINAPRERLKLLQGRLSDLLQDCVDEINAATKRKDRSAHGFKRGKSIVTNASQHRHRRWIFNLDLEEFFPSINFGRVMGFLIKNRDFTLHEDVATTIAQIACVDGALPQGSPCSPVISNLVGSILDVRLVRVAAAAGCTYSRYADDLTFSTNKKAFPPEIASATPGSLHLWQPGGELRGVIERAGFSINASKTHMMYRNSRQGVTGLVVNRKVNVRAEYRRTVRAMVHRLIRTGSFQVLRPTQDSGAVVLKGRPGRLNELHGMLGFINGTDLFNQRRNPRDVPDGVGKKEDAYRQFLFYSHFYAAPAPVIMCEGGTDNVYLTHAIRSLAAQYPDLAQIKKDGKIQIKVRLYKYPRTSTARILGLHDGGTGGLKHLIFSYRDETAAFTAPGGMREPVVILFDNDSGAGAVQSAVKQITKQQATPPFLRILKNLYAVPTPLPTGANESKIEDFFEAATKAIPYNGKTFHDGPGFDTAKHISKQIFAHRVVTPNAAKINFNGFKPLLDNLVTVINAHKGSLLQAPSPLPTAPTTPGQTGP